MNAKQMQAAIEAAIAKHANANLPGKWSVNSGEGYITNVTGLAPAKEVNHE